MIYKLLMNILVLTWSFSLCSEESIKGLRNLAIS